MAPELFKRKPSFTKKSDVYSLGFTFWEIASRKIPFSDVADPKLVPMFVEKGEREDIPADCPPKLATLITYCWHKKWINVPVLRRLWSTSTLLRHLFPCNGCCCCKKVNLILRRLSHA